MNKLPTPEIVFRLGAESMRSHLVAWAMMRGLSTVAIDMLSVEPPKFSMPEIFTIEPDQPAPDRGAP